MTETIAQEMHGAALPWAAKQLRQRDLQSRMSIADGVLHAEQAALDQAAQKLAPEHLGLGLADVKADDLSPAGLVHRMCDHHALARHTAAITNLLDLRVNKQIRIAALKRAGPECLDLLVKASADPQNLAAAHAKPEALDELIDTPGGNPAHIRLLHDRDQCLLGALAGLQ